MPSAGTVFLTVLPDLKGFQAAIAAQTVGARGGFAALGKAGGVAVAAGLAIGLKASVDASREFESAFAGVRKTVDATEEEFFDLSKGIRNMAKEIPATTTEISGVAEAAGQLGIETKSILGFTRTMVDLGNTTNLSATQAATSLARLANITQMPQDQFDQLGSTIVELGNNLATTESEIVEMGLRLAGAGHQVGLAEHQILGLAGALTSVGIRAEAGGTSVSRVLITMAREVETGGEKLRVFARIAGMTSQQFSKAFRQDAAGALASLVEGLGARGKGGAIGALEELGITERRVQDAMLRLAGAGGTLRKSLSLSSGAWQKNNALTTEAEKRYATFDSRLQVFKNTVKDVGISVGTGLLPALGRVVTALGAVINAVVSATEALARFAANVSVALESSRANFPGGGGKGGRFIRPRQHGGPVSAGGAYLVGESGPELLMMGSRSGNIVPNGGGGTQRIVGVLHTAFGPAQMEAIAVDAADGVVDEALRGLFQGGI